MRITSRELSGEGDLDRVNNVAPGLAHLAPISAVHKAVAHNARCQGQRHGVSHSEEWGALTKSKGSTRERNVRAEEHAGPDNGVEPGNVLVLM